MIQQKKGERIFVWPVQKSSPGSLGPYDCMKRPRHQKLARPSLMAQPVETILNVLFIFFLGFWNNNEEQWRRQPATHANLDTPSLVFNWRSTHHSVLMQLCSVFVLKREGWQIKRVLESYGVAYWTQAEDPGLSRGLSCEVIQTED